MTALTVPVSGQAINASWGSAVTDSINNRTTSTIAASSAITTTQTQVIGRTIAANTLSAGSTYRLKAVGVITSTAANAVTFRCRIGTTTLTGNIAGSRNPTATTTASANSFTIEALFTVRSIGATGTCLSNMLVIGEAAQPFSVSVAQTTSTATVVVNTTVANILELTAVTAAATTSVTFHQATIEQLTA
jgi:hypothetical protein